MDPVVRILSLSTVPGRPSATLPLHDRRAGRMMSEYDVIGTGDPR